MTNHSANPNNKKATQSNDKMSSINWQNGLIKNCVRDMKENIAADYIKYMYTAYSVCVSAQAENHTKSPISSRGLSWLR